MLTTLAVLGGVIALWLVLNLKLSRPDGDIIKGLHPYRTMMHYIMPTRNESVVYFDTYVDVAQLLEYVKKADDRFHVDISHCLVGAASVGLAENPTMNRFVVGRRMYQRRGNIVTFSMKRKKLDNKAKLAAVKMEMIEGETFEGLCTRINEQIGVERSDKKTYADKELGGLSMIPRPFLKIGVAFFRWLDYYNLLPAGFIKGDGMYTSMFIANLGSLGMDPGYHHLFEWGTCPLFMMVGKIHDRPVVVDGEVKVQKAMHIRWSYDERIDDGLTARHGIDSVVKALEDPFQYLGCLDEKGSDARPLDLDRRTE